MTGQHMSGLLGEISEAYQAVKQVPMLEARIRELEAKLVMDGQTIAHREQRIHQLKQDQDALYAKLRSVEAERDDAGFQVLVAQDKLDATKAVLKTLFHDAGEVLKAIEPPKVVEPTPAAEPTPTPPPVVASATSSASTQITVEAPVEVAPPLPLPSAPEATSTPSESALPSSAEAPADVPQPASIESGESASHPTPAPDSSTSSGTDLAGAGTSPPAPSFSFAPTGDILSAGHYSGKLYIKEPIICSRSEWLAGGGTDATFDWRPGMEIPAEARARSVA